MSLLRVAARTFTSLLLSLHFRRAQAKRHRGEELGRALQHILKVRRPSGHPRICHWCRAFPAGASRTHHCDVCPGCRRHRQAHNPDFLSGAGILAGLYFDDVYPSPLLAAALNATVAGCPTLSVANTVRKQYHAIAELEQYERRTFVRCVLVELELLRRGN